MQQHLDRINAISQAAWIIGPIAIVLTALRVAYLRRAGLRVTGTAVKTRREARTETKPFSDGTSRWRTYYVDVTDVTYVDHTGCRHHCTVDGRHRPGAPVPLVFTSGAPHRAKDASAASYVQVLIAIVCFVLVMVVPAVMRTKTAEDITRFCSGLSAEDQAFHDC